MLAVISPAKKLDWTERTGARTSAPLFQADAVHLARVAARLSRGELRKLMGISEALADLNARRFAAFCEAPGRDAVRPAMHAFAGDTYQGLHAQSLSADDVAHAQAHLRILSGLYGVLRPCDAIQPYRLEMGSRLETDAGSTLYAYWGGRIAEALNAQARETGSDVLVNCASKEYFGAVDLSVLAPRVVTPVFLEERGGAARVISFHAKRARGALARFIVEERVRDAASLRAFGHGGYRFDAARSTPDAPVFVRPESGRTAA